MRIDSLSGRTGLFAVIILFLVLGLPSSFVPLLGASDEGSTPPIVDAQGQPVRGSVASLEPMMLGGVKQWVLIRAHDIWNPVLLVLDSAPGVSHMAWQRRYLPDLEKHFIVVNWDQRGAGKSYMPGQSEKQLQLDQFVGDTIEMARTLRERFRQDKIYVLGQGFGALVATLAAQKQPELFHALVNVAPLVNPAANDQFVYETALKGAKDAGDPAANELTTNGPPPYGGKDAYAKWAAAETAALRLSWTRYPSNAYRETSPTAVQDAPEYSATEKQRWAKARVDTFNALYPQLARVDLGVQAPTLSVPIYVVMGRFDLTTSSPLVEKYVAGLTAPKKSLVWFEASADAPHFEEPGRFLELMRTTVLPETAKARPMTD